MVQLVNGSVLLPNPADWAAPPVWKRTWQTGLTTAITGDESRQQMRALPREEVSWVIAALSLEERAALDAVLDAASQSGLVCAPYWGRGVAIGAPANAGAGSLVLADTSWDWQPLDYIFLSNLDGTFDLVQIESIGNSSVPTTADSTLVTADTTHHTADEGIGSVDSLTFAPDLVYNYPSGALIWPLLFGKFSMEKQTAITSWHADVKVTLAELVARHQPVVGAPPAAGVGIGNMIVGSTYVVG